MQRHFSPEKKKVIFFDMNNTLLDQEHTFNTSFVTVLKDFTARLETDEQPSDPKAILVQYLREKKRQTNLKASHEHFPKEIELNSLRYALKPYPFELSDAFLTKVLRRIKEQQIEHIQPFPDVLEALKALSKNYKLAIISNNNQAAQAANLNKLGLSSVIPSEHLFTPDMGKQRKPHPGIFKYALSAMGIRAAEAVMVGNSWKHDIYGATRVGMDAVWLKRSHTKKISQKKIGREKVIIVRSCKQLLNIF